MNPKRHRQSNELGVQSSGHCGAGIFAPMRIRIDQRGREAGLAIAGKEKHEGKV